jgi:hypothetical protein
MANAATRHGVGWHNVFARPPPFNILEAQEEVHSLAHAEWLALLLDRDAADCGTKRFQTRLPAARLRHSQAR